MLGATIDMDLFKLATLKLYISNNIY